MKILLIPFVLTLIGCTPRPKPATIPAGTEIVIPHSCITSDIVCKQVGSDMRCKFDQFAGCEQVHVTK